MEGRTYERTLNIKKPRFKNGKYTLTNMINK